MNNDYLSKPRTIILAAGEGTRLRPYTYELPKCMVKINGKSLIDRQLNVLSNLDLEDVVIIGGYKADMLTGKSKILIKNDQYKDTNMLWTLFCGEELLQDEIIVSYGDIVYSEEVLEKLLKSKADISVIVDNEWHSYWKSRIDNPLDDAETLKINKDGKICEIGQKPDHISDIEGQYIGLMKFSAKGISIIKKLFKTESDGSTSFLKRNLRNAYMTDFLQALIDSGEEIHPIYINGDWVEIDTVEDLNSSVTVERLKSIDKKISKI